MISHYNTFLSIFFSESRHQRVDSAIHFYRSSLAKGFCRFCKLQKHQCQCTSAPVHQCTSANVFRFPVRMSVKSLLIECVCSCEQKPYLHNETKGGICIKIDFNPQKNIISLLQDGHRFFVYSSNMAVVTSCEHTL